MASNRQFGTELSVNLTTPLSTSPLKRSASNYSDSIDTRPGKKPRTLTNWGLHFRDHAYQLPSQRKRVEISRPRQAKVDVILFLEYHRVLKPKSPPEPPKRAGPDARAEYQHHLAEWQTDEYILQLNSKRQPGF